MTIRVLRGGLTSNYWKQESCVVRIYSMSVEQLTRQGIQKDNPNGYLSINFDIASKGGGTTCITVEIQPNEFDKLAREMLLTNKKAAHKAFGRAMQALG